MKTAPLAILNISDTQDALRVIVRAAIREVALRANSAPPVEGVTVVGDMTIDRLRHTMTIAGTIRPLQPREFALIRCITIWKINIADSVYINDGVNIASELSIRIRKNVKIGDLVTIHGTNYHEIDPSPPIRIAPIINEDNVWFGRSVSVMI